MQSQSGVSSEVFLGNKVILQFIQECKDPKNSQVQSLTTLLDIEFYYKVDSVTMVKEWTNRPMKQSPKIDLHLIYENDTTKNLCGKRQSFQLIVLRHGKSV